MTDAFLGLKVLVLLHSGVKLEGTVSQIEASNHQMTLKDVTLYFYGQAPHYTPVYGVVGKDIKDLQVFTLAQEPQTPQTNHDNTKPKLLDHHVLEQVPPPPFSSTTQQSNQNKALTPIKSVSKSRKLKQQQQQQQQQQQIQTPNRKRNVVSDGWAGEDVNIFREEEFDFQKNLDMFDKAKVFAEIRESDETAPEELLVTLNRLPQKKINLLPTENVLDSMEHTPYHDDDDDEEDEDIGLGDESDDDSQTPDEYTSRRRRARRRKTNQTKRNPLLVKKTTKIVTAKGGILCPSVSPLQMAHVEHECTQNSSSFEELAIENGGRGSCLLILQVLSQMDVVSPSVIILVGNNKNGALGLVAARHLINHGCMVTVCITTPHQYLCSAVLKYEAMARKFGAEVTYSTNELSQADLVVDAILGCEDKLVDIQEHAPTYEGVCKSLYWANHQDKPVLSIDFPSGMDASTGISQHDEHRIHHPTWTICLGAPKTGCKGLNITGKLYLVDIGIPRLCWKRVGIKGNTIPWGADFLVALEYD